MMKQSDGEAKSHFLVLSPREERKPRLRKTAQNKEIGRNNCLVMTEKNVTILKEFSFQKLCFYLDNTKAITM